MINDLTYNALWVVCLVTLCLAVVLLIWNLLRRLAKKPPARLGKNLNEESEMVQHVVYIVMAIMLFPMLWLSTMGRRWLAWPLGILYISILFLSIRDAVRFMRTKRGKLKQKRHE
jgi:cell division protein FtsW (lipid II flippase)